MGSFIFGSKKKTVASSSKTHSKEEKTEGKEMSKIRALATLPPTETLEIDNGLSLVPRVKLTLTVYPALPSSATKPVDEWMLKRSLIEFTKTSLSSTVPEDDLEIRRFKDVKKRKRDEPVAHGSLCIRDLGFLNSKKGEGSEDLKVMEKAFLDWRKYVVEKMDGMELNLQGEKYRLSVTIPHSDDFEGMKKAWEDFHAFESKGYLRGGREEPDTIVIRGVPSRWFAEPMVVSSKPSLLVTHTIFTSFGEIRNLNVAEDDDQGNDAGMNGWGIISGLHCKIVVQFKKHRDFYNALKVLCGRSLQKEGSRLKVDYEVTWTKDGFFRDSGSRAQETGRIPAAAGGQHRSEAFRREQRMYQFSSNDTRRRRFKE